ncbi:MAG: HEAT repeat domain-containing protein [Planctomycetota bacterium]
MFKNIKSAGIGGLLFLMIASLALGDIVRLKNGSTLEGKIVSQDKKSVVIELSHGTITVKISNIAEIIKGDVEAEVEDEKVEPKETVKIDNTNPLTPTIEKTSVPVSTKRDAPLVLSDEGLNPAQIEINEIIRKIVNTKESEDAWQLVEKLIVKGKADKPYMVGLLGSVQNRAALKWIVYAVGQLELKECIKLFYEMLQSETDETIRIEIFESLGRMKDVSTVALIRKQLGLEKLNNVKIALINILSRAADVDSFSILLDLLDDKDDTLSHTAALAITNIYSNAGPKALEDVDFKSMLQRKIADAGVKGKKGVISLLGQMNNQDAVDMLIKFLDDENTDIRSESVMALSAIQDARVIEVLTGKLYTEKDLWTRMQIIQAMGDSKNQSLISTLIELLQDSEEKIRLSAARSLGKLTNKFLGDNYDDWKNWWETTQGSKK